MPLEPGLTGAAAATVGPDDTARALGSGDVDVLGTPRALALLEAATVAALAGALPADATSVGSRVELDHRAPTAVGTGVLAEAELTVVDGRRLTFAVRLLELPERREVVRGTVVRAVVDRSRFG